jgi:hypothetical protein
MGPLFIFVFVIIGILIGSLIPAFLAKLLMKWVFGRRVHFGLVLLATVLSTLFMVAIYVGLIWYSEGRLDPRTFENFEQSLTSAETGLVWVFGFMLQLLLTTLIVPDENMQLIGAWKWAVIIILQYLLFFVVVFAIAFALAGSGAFAEASQIQTRVV